MAAVQPKIGNILGIDEAGRGCVLGPMLIAGVMARAEDQEKLKACGIKNSKKLSPKRREYLFDALTKLPCTVVSVSVPPSDIDARSINAIGIDISGRFIDDLKPDIAIVDAPASGRGVIWYADRILAATISTKRVQIISENHADDNHITVAAASVIAKVLRDRAIRELHKKYDVDFGSGYQHDPKTIKFLLDYYKSHGSLPVETRLKWSTAQRILTGGGAHIR